MELIIQLIGGLIGGNATGAVAKNLSLGTAGNSIAGLIGGAGLPLILGRFGGGGAEVADAAAAASGMDIGSIVGGLASGGAGGVVLTLIAGLIKKQMAK